MSIVTNHICDKCGKSGTENGEYQKPEGWYGLRIWQELNDKMVETADGEYCSVDCLIKKMEEVGVSIKQ
jgi:hypothetical protein